MTLSFITDQKIINSLNSTCQSSAVTEKFTLIYKSNILCASFLQMLKSCNYHSLFKVFRVCVINAIFWHYIIRIIASKCNFSFFQFSFLVVMLLKLTLSENYILLIYYKLFFLRR